MPDPLDSAAVEAAYHAWDTYEYTDRKGALEAAITAYLARAAQPSPELPHFKAAVQTEMSGGELEAVKRERAEARASLERLQREVLGETYSDEGAQVVLDDLARTKAELAEARASLERLEGECAVCEKCGHVQAEPNWCHKCRHRTTPPEWAKPLLDAWFERDDLQEQRDEAVARAEKAERTAARLQNRVLELSRAEADRQEEERPPHA